MCIKLLEESVLRSLFTHENLVGSDKLLNPSPPLECVSGLENSLELPLEYASDATLSFNLTMQPELDISKTATCTTCRFKEDKSNYWTAVMYFKHANGSFLRVRIIH